MTNMLVHEVLLKAMDKAHEGITIADASQPDFPLVYVNEGFSRMTGYGQQESVGKNCRFLQGSGTDPKAVDSIRQAVKAQIPVQVELLNYRRNGTPFWNRLSLTPIFNADGCLTHYIGVQDDISALKEKEKFKQQYKLQQWATRAAVAAQEREKKYLGIELHDNVNQLLASASLFLNTAQRCPNDNAQLITEARDILETAINEIRKLSHSLVGIDVKRISLVQALQQLFTAYESAGAFALCFEAGPVDEGQLNDKTKLAIYRIAQEQLSNIVKHARAARVQVCLRQHEGGLLLNIKDNGVGFDVQTKASGIGLQNMQTRASLIHAALLIDAAPGAGCTMQLTVPLVEQAIKNSRQAFY